MKNTKFDTKMKNRLFCIIFIQVNLELSNNKIDMKNRASDFE